MSSTLCFASEPVRKTWNVDGLEREALVYLPPSGREKPPVVFSFHGHGGNMYTFTTIYPIHQLWPEAFVVWPQGLNTVGVLTDPAGKKSGWQYKPGILGDRDIKFVDAILRTLRTEHHIDDGRIYASGFSNGGSFTYVLWAQRGDAFAAFAPMAAIGESVAGLLKPKPVFVAGGTKDTLVKFKWQERMLEQLKKLNQCTGETEQVGEEPLNLRYKSKIGLLTESYFYPRGHAHDPKTPDILVNFFKKVDSTHQ